MNEYLKLLLILYSEKGYSFNETMDRLKANCPNALKPADAKAIRQWFMDTLGYLD
jgi:hypothetical protein